MRRTTVRHSSALGPRARTSTFLVQRTTVAGTLFQKIPIQSITHDRDEGKCLKSKASVSDGITQSDENSWFTKLKEKLPILNYSDILTRGVVTIIMLAVARSGHFIPLPNIDMAAVPSSVASSAGEKLMAALYGKVQELPASLFYLGISPMINASIMVALFLLFPPALLGNPSWLVQLHAAKKEGKAGEATMNTWTNALGLIIAMYLGVLRAVELESYALSPSGWFIPCTALALIAGSCVVQFCATNITASGIGNGSTLIICTGIVAEYADTLRSLLVGVASGSMPLMGICILLGGYLGLTLLAVYLGSTELRIPVVQYSTTMTKPGSKNIAPLVAAKAMTDHARIDSSSLRRPYFPVQLNASGMMPVIFAGALYFGLLPHALEMMGQTALSASVVAVQQSWMGLVFYAMLVFAMEFVPVGALNPKDVAEYLDTMNIGMKGVAPGSTTERFLTGQVLRCKFWGGIGLAFLAVTAHAFDSICANILGTTLATTSLLIIVGAVIQTSRQIESLMEGPRLQQQLEKERKLIQSVSAL